MSGRTAPPREDSFVRSRLVTPLFFLFLMGTLDVILTLIGLAHGGRELNPYARLLLSHGIVAFVAARVATTALAAGAFAYLAPKAPRVARACTLTLAIFFAIVNAFSLAQLVIS